MTDRPKPDADLTKKAKELIEAVEADEVRHGGYCPELRCSWRVSYGWFWGRVRA